MRRVDVGLVRQLLQAQFPAWADLPLTPIRHGGTDNAIFRLGDHLAARLPRVGWAAGQAEKEHAWLPRLAPHLPLPVPTPLGLGQPAEGYPWRWTVSRWIDGEPLPPVLLDDAVVANDLAAFIAALQGIDTAGGPEPGPHNFYRGVPLRQRDRVTRESIAEAADELDVEIVTAAWAELASAPEHEGPPVWLHGDLHEGNILALDGRLSAVIDFGGLGLGDPACDLAVAWMIFDARTRERFRRAACADDAVWTRARAWALSISLVQIPFYRASHPEIAQLSRRTLREALADR
ncbi:aminoglycoside phosphotransferase family protein [Phenylobacterium sp. J426]|uniref:aminoglycoside phosphotransferase family protein n=1 Tax=Phenylobacterium sp. J426 TaxID=2898439 RepID=UPI002151F4C9|nr:aminoglycoside phosphotransferase family protein [Phenylobacterium sp. J426]MCR5875403.1 aminoglycoside phosphotransferase family protein [Phenylobacterium sp. J426]